MLKRFNGNKAKFLNFWLIIGAIVFLGSFLLTSTVLAVDDNLNDITCGQGPVLNRCDVNQPKCILKTFNWTANGYPGANPPSCTTGSGCPSCCGDDTLEYMTSCAVYGAGATCDATSACCDSGYLPDGRFDCVYGGQCYNTGQRIDTSDAGADLEVCTLTTSSQATWVEPDSGMEDQGTGLNPCTGFSFDNAWTTGSFGTDDFNSNFSDGYCCGDDSGEWTHTLHCISGDSSDNQATSWCEGLWPNYPKSCCNTPLLQDGGNPMCTGMDGNCHAAGAEMQFYFSGNDQTVYCYDSSGFNIGDETVFWADCDRLYGAVLRCNASTCGSTNGIKAGELPVGEYTDTSTNECCGDDNNEYPRTCTPDPLTGLDWACSTQSCCSYYTECVTPTGECTNNGLSERVAWSGLNPGGDDTVAVCGSGTGGWSDSDFSQSFCSTGVTYGIWPEQRWIYAGEIGVGEYPGTATLGCCGDDSGENYAPVCPGVIGVDPRCCDNATDKIDSAGNCVAVCPNGPPSINLSLPANGATCQPVTGTILTWNANDPDGDTPLTFYLYHSDDYDLVEQFDPMAYLTTVVLPNGQASYSFTLLNTYNYNTTYYWNVIVDDGQGHQNWNSEVWSYTTERCNPDISGPNLPLNACCNADGCSLIPLDGQPRTYTDSFGCAPNTCPSSCTISQTDYYCNGTDSLMHQQSVAGSICGACELWDGNSACTVTGCGECSGSITCDAFICDHDTFYQPRLPGGCDLGTCGCPGFDDYGTCEQSWNNCADPTFRVECFQGSGCDTTNNICECQAGYTPDGAGSCLNTSGGPTVVIAEAKVCLVQDTTVYFESDVSDGSGIYSYDWNFGDLLQHSYLANPSHTYPASVGYTVTLIVTDDNTLKQGIDTYTFSWPPPACDPSFNFTNLIPFSSTQMTLQWDVSPGATGYQIYRDGALIVSCVYSCDNSCSCTDTNLLPGTEYEYYIRALPSDKNNSTIICIGGTGDFGIKCPLSDFTKSDVTGLNVTSSQCGQISVAWDDLGADYTYNIYKDINSVNNITAPDDLAVSGLADPFYADTEIIPGQIYYYKVTSVNALKTPSESDLGDAPSGGASSYCFRGPLWEEK